MFIFYQNCHMLFFVSTQKLIIYKFDLLYHILNELSLNLNFNIIKGEKLLVERINIFGNNVTRENVIRNQFEVDEGEYYNEILQSKTINNLKNLGFFISYLVLVAPSALRLTLVVEKFVELA